MTAPRYVYAIGRALDHAGLAGLIGIDGAEVHLVAVRDLVAVVSAAPPDEAALQARLERLHELATVAEAHHAVVAAVATQTVVAPFRLATIYQDEHRVRELLRHWYEEFEALLDRLAGTVEVGVKVSGSKYTWTTGHRLGPLRAAPAGHASSSSASGTGGATRSGSTRRRPPNGSTPRSARTPSTAATTAPSPPSSRALPATTSSTPPTWYPPHAHRVHRAGPAARHGRAGPAGRGHRTVGTVLVRRTRSR